MEAVNCKQTNKQRNKQTNNKQTNRTGGSPPYMILCICAYTRQNLLFQGTMVDHWKSHRTNNCLNTCVQLPQFGLSNMECHGQCMCFLSVSCVLCLGGLLIPNSLKLWRSNPSDAVSYMILADLSYE
jgi:hypothetical protein